MIDAYHLRAYLLLIVTTLCWGLNAIFGKLAIDEISPMQLVTFRWLGVVILLRYSPRKHIVRDWPILRRHLPFLCLMGSCGFTAFNALFYVAAIIPRRLISVYYRARYRFTCCLAVGCAWRHQITTGTGTGL